MHFSLGILLTATSIAACSTAPGLFSPNQSEWPAQSVDLGLHSPEGAPRLLIQRAFGGSGDDMAYDIWPAPGGGFVVTGSTQDDSGNVDLVIASLDDRGRLRWAKQFGSWNIEIGFAVRVLRDQTIVVAGWTRGFGNGEGDFYVVGVDRDGQLKFERTFGGKGEERATSLIATADGGALIAGESYSFGSDARFYVVKIDARGNQEWEQSYNRGPLNERALAIVAAGAGYLLVGNSMDSTSGSTAQASDGYVVRIDALGQELWSKSYGEGEHDIVHYVAPLANGTFLLSGYTTGYGARGESDIWLLTIDARGDVIDQRVIGGPAADHNIVARPSPWGATYLVGYTNSYGAGDWDIDLAELSEHGEIMWKHAYGSPRDEGGTALSAMQGNLLAVTGYAVHSRGDRDMLFLIIDTATNR